MTAPARIRSELGELSQQFSSLAQLAREPQKLPLFVAEYQRWYTRAVRLLGSMRSGTTGGRAVFFSGTGSSMA